MSSPRKRSALHTLLLARASIACALYVVLTYCFMGLAYGPIQIRPAEALTMLPLVFPESVWGLWIGCMLANIASPLAVWDVLVGGAITLAMGICTYLARRIPNKPLRIIVGGLPPVLGNAFLLPLVWLLLGTDTAYWLNALYLFATQALFVYGLGTPLVLLSIRLQEKGVRGFLSEK